MNVFNENYLLEYQKCASEFVDYCNRIKSISLKEWLTGYKIYYIGKYIEYSSTIEILEALLNVNVYTYYNEEAIQYKKLYETIKKDQKYARLEKVANNNASHK